MRQEINLYRKAGGPGMAGLTARRLMQGAGVAVALAALTFGIVYWDTHRMRSALHAADRAHERALTDLEAATAKAAQRLPADALQRELARLESLHDAIRHLESSLAQDRFANRDGYSRYLIGLARHSVEGVWLTAVTIRGAGRALEFEGRSIEPELVPRYLARLSTEPPLNGTEFRTFRMQRPAVEPGQAAVPFVEFAIRTDPPGAGEEGGHGDARPVP